MAPYYLLYTPERTYKRDWESHFLNGWALHRLRLPGVTCDVCGTTGGHGRVLPFECPLSIREEVELVLERGNIPIKELKRYTNRWEVALREQGIETELIACASFPSLVWNVPSRPVYDFYWPFCAEKVVHQRVRDLIVDRGFTGAAFHPVVIETMGLLEPTANYVSMLITDRDRKYFSRERRYNVAHGDYDVMFRRLPHTTDQYIIQSTAPRYYSVCFEHFLRLQVLGDEYQPERCPECGSEFFEETDVHKRIIGQLKGKGLIPRQCLPELDIFYSGVHRGIVINEAVYSALSPLEPTNVKIRELATC